MSKPASIIIPVFNQLHFTRDCLDSLLSDTDRPPYEVIVIDNASSDGTREYLAERAERLKGTRDVLIPVHNETNRGVAPAWNQGLKLATGDLIAILNNDIVVPRGWFAGLVWALDFHGAGLISPFAQCGTLDYDLPARAARFMKRNRKRFWADFDFCAVLLSRKTYEKLGLFDENFLVGGYEDTDYAYRMRKENIRYGVTGASFIHHFGSQTLGEFKRRGDKHAAHNLAYFISKWHEDPSEGVSSLASKLRRSWRKLKLRFDRM